MKQQIKAIINQLKEHSENSAELAQAQLDLLNQTGAGPEAYRAFYDDVKGALAAFK